MNRADLQLLVRERLREVKALLAARCWSGAYYLAGYIVEYALKSCIIKHVMATDVFPERRFSEQCWTHKLDQLLSLARLDALLATDSVADAILKQNWETVRDWNETSRYGTTTKDKAEALYAAIVEKKHGVLSWLKRHW